MSKSFWLVSAGMFALATTPAYAQDQTSPTGQTTPPEESAEVGCGHGPVLHEETEHGLCIDALRFGAFRIIFVPLDENRQRVEILELSFRGFGNRGEPIPPRRAVPGGGAL